MKNLLTTRILDYPVIVIMALVLILTGCTEEEVVQDTTERNEGSLKDIEGNSYQTVKIGEQEWMAENLKTTKLNDGTEIPLVLDNDAWKNLTGMAHTYYDDDEKYINSDGLLYNFFTAQNDNLCPQGWHVPSNAEFETLIDHLGGSSVAAEKMKLTGTEFWDDPNLANNESGFAALGAGKVSENAVYSSRGNYAHFWTSSTADGNSSKVFAKRIRLVHENTVVGLGIAIKNNGYSIRCVKD